jgi:hypothetical protein
MIFEEKNHFFKNFFSNEMVGQNCEYTGGGCICQNGVINTNIAKP